ncbi:protein mono-ADP-ribosyltransferase PARP14 isoform X1 [Danio rerio]|uniref:Poly [ADP-ribose] polymerase n=1 Tax=Danio rerio TaxID=7955 RepID=A0A8M9QCF0_DANRE|nr:poly [ADP-ribose] polymerase 14-like [Danio rerio]|eukprot:XP_021333371.1 poly [ADP-ribose] polymerase 14-like [Danio rerio]
MENYMYDVCFEAGNLSDSALKHIKRYFNVRRLSGRGDCEIYEVDKDIYKISFTSKKDQEAVLARGDHVINTPEKEDIRVSVRCDNNAKSRKLSNASANQKSASSKGVEKVFKLDQYLLRFLSDCKKPYSELEKLLSALSSTFEINIETEELVVLRDPAGEDASSLKEWELGVDQVIENLKIHNSIHFEFERDKYAILEENHFLQNEDLKIYFEQGSCVAVVVGERNQVDKILKFTSDLQEKQQVKEECQISEKRFALIKEQFESCINSDLPALQIAPKRAGVILLKGPEKDVQEGKEKLAKLAQGIQEKKIPSKYALMNFLDSSDGIKHFQRRFQQSLCSPVMLETSGSDLLLLSLSDEALQEAARVIKRDLSLEIIHLENTQKSSAFTTLKEELSKAVKQANRESVKVELKYQNESSSDAKVQLVGFTTEVNELKNMLLEYKRNHQMHEVRLALQFPEMAKHFSEIMSMAGVKKNSVKIKPTCSSSPCIHLKGPHCAVESLKETLDSYLCSLVTKRFEVKGPGVQQFFLGDGAETLKLVKNSYMVGILPINDEQPRYQVPSYSTSLSILGSASAPSTHQSPDYENIIHIKVVVGSLEQQKADVFVVPMVQANMTSTLIGSSLFKKSGQQLQTNFNTVKGRGTLTPGDVLIVDATPGLGCSKVFFIECAPKGKKLTEKVLRCALVCVFTLCEQNSFGSVALPVIGPGEVLSIPVKDSVNILTQEICKFLSQPTVFLHTIYIPIMPNYSHSEEMFETVLGNFSKKMVDKKGQALFLSLTSDLDEVIMAVNGIQLHLVFGDITNETTDAIVNTTDFKDFQTNGVCKDILTKAGPHVHAQLKGAQVASGQIFTTPPGGFPCKTIMHVCGERSPSVIKTLAKEIVVQCESGQYQSVAIPAICAGQEGMDPNVVAKSILDGVKEGVQEVNLQYLRNIRIILLKINVFLEFKAVAQQVFSDNTQKTAPASLVPAIVTTRGHSSNSSRPKALPKLSRSLPVGLNFSSLMTHTSALQRSSSLPVDLISGSTSLTRSKPLSLPATPDLSYLLVSLPDTEDKAAFQVIGDRDKDVSDACRELQRAYDSQCSTQSFLSDEIERLTKDELDKLLSKVDSLHLKLETNSSGEWVVKGLRDGVNEVARLIQDALRRQVREKEQDNLFTQVTWCILGVRGIWQKVPEEANHKLERADVNDGIVDAQGVKWTVDIKKMEATACVSGQVTALKRLENLPDFSLPIYWDNMRQNEHLKVVDLDQQSAEYQTVKADFKKTIKQTVLKIERIQNINLRRLYEARKSELEIKNDPAVGAGEKILYHGSAQASCSSIMSTNFNRNFAGQNATVFGHGTYFAVNASYSAQATYAVPAADGTQLMFVARVLTGHYAQGLGNMKTPPVRVAPDQFYDSVVDNTQDPTMFVVFHDCQAYPDYLITFK